MILTCDRYPKEINGLEERLSQDLDGGLPVIISPRVKVSCYPNEKGRGERLRFTPGKRFLWLGK